MKVLVLILCICFGISHQTTLKMSIYYEALCPDSIRFVKEMYKTYKKIGPYLEWSFVPYGFARKQKRGNTWNFYCQHGPQECLSNKAQACALHLSRTVVDQIEYVHCVEDSGDPGSVGTLKKCCKPANLKWENVNRCMESNEGANYLSIYGDLTECIVPLLDFIPTVIFDGKFNQTLQDRAIMDLMGTCCSLLKNEPNECKH